MKYIAIILTFLATIVAAQTTGWKQLPGPMTGTIMTVEVSKDNTVYAVTPDGHIHLRNPTSKEWSESLPNGLISEKINGNYYLPILYNIYLDIKGNQYLCAYITNLAQLTPTQGIYRSSDNGTSWVQVLHTSSVSTIREGSDGNIYAIKKVDGESTMLLRSNDNGLNWNEIATFPFAATDFVVDSKLRCYFCIQSSDKSILMYDVRSELYKSLTPNSSGGVSYYPPNLTLVHDRPFIRFFDDSYFIDDENEFHQRTAVGYQQNSVFPRSLFSSQNGFLYMLSNNGSSTKGYVSLDTGMTWSPLSTQPYDNSTPDPPSAIDSSGNLYLGLSTGVYTTPDNGEHWKQIGLPVANVPLLERSPNGSLFIHDSTLIYQLNYGYYPDLREMISNDSGASWYTTDLLPEGFYGRFEYDDAGGIYYFNYIVDGQSYRYSVWYADTSAPYSFKLQTLFPTAPTSSCAYNGRLYVLAGSSILFTEDKGVTWEAIDVPNTASQLTSFSIAPDGTFYIGYNPSLYRSIDQGKTWNKVLTPIKNTDIRHILFSDTTIILGTSSKGVWRSDDNGVHWDRWDLTTRDTVRTMKIIGNRCYVGTSGGLLSCDVSSNNWKFELFVDEGKPIHQILSLDDKRIYVTVEDKGIWTNDLTLNSIHKPYTSNSNMRVTYDGAGNGNAIYLTLSERKEITLSLYDILGKKVQQIADGVYEQGESIIPLSTSSLEAGVYTLLMQSKDGAISEKMVLAH